MKKIFGYLFLMMVTFTFAFANAYAEKKKEEAEEQPTEVVETIGAKKPTLYIFRQTGCPHCADEMSYLDSHYCNYEERFNIVIYNIYDADNADLVLDVCEALGMEYQGAPFNVIGTKTYVGYADSVADDFNSFLDYGYGANEEDVVAKVIKEKKYTNIKSTTLFEALDEEGIERHTSEECGSDEKKSNDTAVIVSIFAGVVVATGLLIYFSKRK